MAKFKTLSGKLIDVAERMNPFSIALLGGLQEKTTYQGRLSGGYKPEEVRKRRARNKVARRQRKINAHK